MDINELKPDQKVVLESAFISDVTYESGSKVCVLAASAQNAEDEATWWRFEVPRTAKVIRKFFATFGVSHDRLTPGRFPNLVGPEESRFFLFKPSIRVEGSFVGVEEVPTEQDEEKLTAVRDLKGVSLRFAV